MELEKLTILDFALDAVESVFDTNTEELSSALNYTTYLFTSQGLDNVLYLDFEVEFPEFCQDPFKLINFLETNEGRLQVGKMMRKKYYLEQKFSQKPTKYHADEFDKDDYEESQRISQIPFHI